MNKRTIPQCFALPQDTITLARELRRIENKRGALPRSVQHLADVIKRELATRAGAALVRVWA